MFNQKRLTGLLVFLTILPFGVLCFYSHPGADDFSDAVQRRDAGFWQMQHDLYLHLTGRLFTSVLLAGASPLELDALRHYWVVPLITLALLLVSLYALITAVLGATWTAAARWLGAAVVLALWLLQNPSVAESVYWFNGLAVYTVPVAMLLFWLTALVRYWQASGRRHQLSWLGINLLLGTCVLWSNEIIALPLLAAVAGLCLWEWRRRGPRRQELAGTLAWLGAALLVSLLAPGNMARAAIIAVPVSLPWMVGGSMASTAYLLLNWASSGVLLAGTALVLPALARAVLLAPPPSICRLKALRPGQLLTAGLGLLALLPLAALPNYYATGGLMPPRARASIYLLFLLGWFAAVLASLVVARTAPWLRALATRRAGWPRPATGLLWAVLLLNLATDHNLRVAHRDLGRASNNAVLAYRDWFSGAAARYDATLQARYRLLSATPGQRQQVAALAKAARPPSLLYYDITTDSTCTLNQDYARYFHQKAVWTGPGGQGRPPKFYQAPTDDD